MIGGGNEFVQVHYSNNNHQLIISTINCHLVVKVYDSMNAAILLTKQHTSIPVSTERVISNLKNNSDLFALNQLRRLFDSGYQLTVG